MQCKCVSLRPKDNRLLLSPGSLLMWMRVFCLNRTFLSMYLAHVFSECGGRNISLPESFPLCAFEKTVHGLVLSLAVINASVKQADQRFFFFFSVWKFNSVVFSDQQVLMSQDCGVMRPNLRFGGELCEKKLPYICEKKENSHQAKTPGGT